jgi:hypothetical protein
VNLGEDLPAHGALIEPVLIMGMCWGLAIFLQ